MKYKKPFLLFWLISLSLLAISNSAFAQSWNPNHSVGTSTGNCNFSYNQTPSQLVEVNQASFPNTGLSFQWEQSTAPTAGFTAISGATLSSYTFPGPLEQTTYYRRKTIQSASNYVYSNIIKIRVVSVNWEDINYVREHDVLKTGITTWQAVDVLPIGQKLQTTNYLDGLGRSIEQVSRETATPAPGSTLWGDVVQFSQYDAFGREPKQYLPYTTTSQSGKFKTAPLTEQPQYYTTTYNETSAFSSLTFDNSPLNRIKNVKDPGTTWALSAGNTADYNMNSAADNVQMFSVDYLQGSAPVSKGAYPANSLYKIIYTDENDKQVVEYTNKSGQLILRKIQLDNVLSAAHTGWICTYSIYDDFGLLRYELQPEAVKYLDANNWSLEGTNGQEVLNEWCFQYDYDDKGRTIWKKAPGAKPLKMLYDIRDRVVFMQDGNQALKSPVEWTANLYDELDRPVITTLYRTSKSVTDLQNDINNSVTLTTVTVTNPSQSVTDLVVDIRQAGVTQYTAQNSIEFISNGSEGFESGIGDDFIAEIDPAAVAPGTVVTTATFNNPIVTADLNNPAVSTVIKYQFYDTYAFSEAKAFDHNFDNTSAYSNSDANVLPIITTKRTINHLTGSKVRVLGTHTFLSTTNYYDEEGRLIQTIESNIKSGQDITTFQYHFDGRLLSTHSKHTTANSGYSHFGILTKNVFDNIGRISSVQKRYGSNPFHTIASYEYDDMGRLKTKRLDPGYTGSGKTELESLVYTYNIHNNITGINKDYALKTPGKYNKWGHFFGLYLGYDNRDGTFAAEKLNGQVTGLLWNTQGDDAQRKYDYNYDNAGRLINAAFKERQTAEDTWSNAKMDFSVTGYAGKIEYDLNGNLLSMMQKGVLVGNSAPVTIDDLRYSYASFSNKLLKVTDNTTLGANNGQFGDFKDGGNGTADDYVYDANGNLVIDLNKGAKELAGVAGANGIRYNFLDKPEEIRIVGKGTINIVYDADGSKLQKKYTPEGGTAVTTTYINAFVYQGDALQYINFEEGRIRVMQPVSQSNGYDALTVDGNLALPNGKEGVYDYYIRDYQENVRMILTEEIHQGSNQSTMEMERATEEEAIFGQAGAANEVAQTRFAVNNIPGQTSGGGWQNASIGSYVSRLGNLAGKKAGPNALLKVMAGDMINATTQYYYKNPVVNGSGSTLVNDVLNTLVQAITGSAVTGSLTKGAASNISGQLNLNTPFKTLVAPDATTTTGTAPKAYLTIIFFDERFGYMGESSQSLRVEQSPGSNASLTLANIKAPKNGYCFVYLSNESDEMVYFDNFQVGHTRGRIIEENHYYSYGLKIAAISSKKGGDATYEGHLQNNYQYQGAFSEMDEDIGWNDFALRNYDAQVGRWVQQDPYQQFASPYLGMGNDPVNGVDPSGGIYIAPARAVASVLGTASKAAGAASSTIGTISKVVSITSMAIQTTVITANIINTGITTNGVGDNSSPDDYIRVETKSKRIYVTETDDPFDIVHIDDQKRFIRYDKGAAEKEYRARGYKVSAGPEGVGMDAVDNAIITLAGAKVFKWAFGRVASWWAGRAVKTGLTSSQLGKVIGWGEGQGAEAVQQTINVAKNLTKSQVKKWAKQGLTKSWVQDQLAKYSSSVIKGGDKLKNTQLMHRKELMEKILNLWD